MSEEHLKGKPVTVVYSIEDPQAWRDSGNPLRYAHHGLQAHTVSAYDAVERCYALEEELRRVRDSLDRDDRDSIDKVLEFKP